MRNRKRVRPERQLRIIGGEWRGRKFRFPEDDGIRPTPDRVRETLFNWLVGRVDGAHALDLFAGSGALGLEALSRGASRVTFVEHSAVAARAIEAVLATFGASGADVVRADALHFLAGAPRPFDLVFVDPPFDSDLLLRTVSVLDERGWLAADARVYLEGPANMSVAELPADWRILKSSRAGDVGYHLAQPAARGSDSE